MRDSIVEKLRVVLSGEVNDECKVTYVLAEVRKLLDKFPPDPAPFALKLYCHWALHVDLTHPGTTKHFLERVEKFVDSVFAGSTNVVYEHQMFREFIFWDTFKEQLTRFLKAYDLPTGVCENDSRWHEFLKNYAGVIEDGSLSCNSGIALKSVQEVVFTKGRARENDSYIPFDLSWNIVLTDGRTMTVDVSAAPLADGKMISHSVTLH